jgi:hypothetical protein
MRPDTRVGRIVGLMLLLQLAGLIVPFVMLRPLMSADYFTNAADYSFQIKAAVLLFFVNGALTIGIAIKAWPIFRAYSEAMALWLIVLSVIMFVLQAIDNVHIMSMLSFSQQYVEAGAAASELNTALAVVVRTTRRWAHYPELFAIDSWLMLFGSILFRFALVPRLLAAFGLVTVLLHFIAVPLSGFLGYGISTVLGVPMAFGLLANAVWLLARGFQAPQDSDAGDVKYDNEIHD